MRLTQENITKEDVRKYHKDKIISRMDNSIQSDTDYYDTYHTIEDLADELNFSRNEDGYVRIPPELLWIEEVLNEELNDYPVLCWKSEIEAQKGSTLKMFFKL